MHSKFSVFTSIYYDYVQELHNMCLFRAKISALCMQNFSVYIPICSSRNLGEGEYFRETRVSLNCGKGDIRWLSAKRSHLLTFSRGHRDLVICLTVKKAGARIYHTKGSQRNLIAGVNDTGFINCFKSECKHVSFLFEVDEDYNGPKNLAYSYSGYIDISKSIFCVYKFTCTVIVQCEQSCIITFLAIHCKY